MEINNQLVGGKGHIVYVYIDIEKKGSGHPKRPIID
jgi:hypothetical protein